MEIKINNCMDCSMHRVQADPDPDDWFCDDDIKVICKICGLEITVACRPHELRKECDIPEWCPILNRK